MRVPRTIVPIALSALLLAAGLTLRALAVSQPGPLYVHETTANQYAILGTSTGSAADAVQGKSSTGYGLFGSTNAATKAGVYGENLASGGSGVVGITRTSTSTRNSFAGVMGHDFSTQQGQAGVEGTSTTGDGVYGLASKTGLGVFGTSPYVGVYGTPTANDGYGVYGYASNITNAYAVFGAANNNVGVGAYASGTGTALTVGTNNASAIVMKAYTYFGGDFMSLDGSGNMILSGTLTQNSTPAIVVRKRGVAHASYAAQTTSPAIEDTGEGRIAGGAGYVAIDPAFAATLDDRAPYEVLVTPMGDCRGLYVTGETPRGFQVRELMGGRSAVAFAYRIVGRPAGTAGTRLPLYTSPFSHSRPPVTSEIAQPPTRH